MMSEKELRAILAGFDVACKGLEKDLTEVCGCHDCYIRYVKFTASLRVVRMILEEETDSERMNTQRAIEELIMLGKNREKWER